MYKPFWMVSLFAAWFFLGAMDASSQSHGTPPRNGSADTQSSQGGSHQRSHQQPAQQGTRRVMSPVCRRLMDSINQLYLDCQGLSARKTRLWNQFMARIEENRGSPSMLGYLESEHNRSRDAISNQMLLVDREILGIIISGQQQRCREASSWHRNDCVQ